MDEIKEIRADIKSLDVRLSKDEKKLAVLEANEVNTKDLVKQNVEAFEKLNTTMQAVCTKLTENTMSVENLGKEVAEVKEQVLSNEKEIDNLKEERNINMMTWLKNNWVSIVLGCGLVAELFKDYI